MALDTYDHLQATILTWLARPGDTLISGSAPDWIALFEAEARRQFRTRLGETAWTPTTTAGVPTLALPSFYAGFRSDISIPPASGLGAWSGVNDSLRYITPEEYNAIWIGSQQGQPIVFTVIGTNIKFAPTPDSTYQLAATYYASIPALSTGNETNWLLTNHPDAYLFGSLVEAEGMIGNDERIPLWKQRRDEAFASIKLDDQKQRWSGSVLVMMTDIGNP